ncbi:MAG: hypothetical protein AB7R89_04260 [Dehalococcoidia bacterium]
MTVTLPFDEAAIAEIAALLGVAACVEPYRVRDAAVYRLVLPNASLGIEVGVIVWPSLSRVDVHLGDCSMVYKGVTEVELIPGVEVIFRRTGAAGYLFVSVGGRVSLVA